MKVLLTCGHPNSGFAQVHDVLVSAGLAPAQPSRREQLTAVDLQARLLKALGVGAGRYEEALTPGRLWHELAVDLFLGNLSLEVWGWADSATVPLLDFWHDFDTQVRFLLVYSAPEFAVGRALQGQPASAEAVDRVIESWTACNNRLLRFFHRHAQRCELVNATSAIHAPAQLVQRLSERWEIALQGPVSEPSKKITDSAVAASLAKALVQDCDGAQTLYAELESAAALDASLGAVAQDMQAWNEYTARQQALTAAERRVEQLRQQVAEQHVSLARAQEEQSKIAVGLRQQVDQLNHARDELAKRAEQQQRQIEQVTREREAQAKLAADGQAQIEQLKKQAAAKDKPADASLQAKMEELKQENELLLLQLHQVQEELEHYYLQTQELGKVNGHSSYLVQFLHANQPAEVIVDFRGEIDGENWWHAEEDGRWAGPQKTSTVKVPALLPGKYLLDLHVVDAMTSAILEGMEIYLNGNHVPTETISGDSYPAVVQGRFSSEQAGADPCWKFEFRFKELMAPSQRGELDDRMLGVRVKELELILEEPAAATAGQISHVQPHVQ